MFFQWHHAAVIKLDGSIAVQHNQTVDKKTHELVYQHGRPYFWREKDSAMQWGNEMEITFERMHPFGLLIQAASGTTTSWSDVPMDKRRILAGKYSLIVARGFGPVEKDEYRRKTTEMGPIQ